MRSAIKWAPLAFLLIFGSSTSSASEVLSRILRTAALDNGLLPSSQLFIARDAALAPIGKSFFESENVSLNGGISCRTCHLDEFGSVDGLPNAVGVFGSGRGPARAFSRGKIVPRNTLPLWGRGGKGFETFFWDGKIDFSGGKTISQFGNMAPSSDALITAVHLPPLEIREMLDDDKTVSLFKRETPSAAPELKAIIVKRLRTAEAEAMKTLAARLDKSLNEVEFFDVARSIAAFIRSEFRLKDTKFHQFVFGRGSLTTDEIKGGIIFYGKGKCVNCHHGPYFSDLKFHAVPFPQLGFGKNGFGVDYGRFNVTFKSSDLYKFRTPPLINVKMTGPYGHSGSISSIQEAISVHFDPLASVDPKSMTVFSRNEFFKRMAASNESFQYLSAISQEEVEQVKSFLEALSFGP